jgi:hypothetical protein
MEEPTLADLILRLYAVVDELKRRFPGRPFTPDGHLVGSLGEVWASNAFGIELHPPSTPIHDGQVDGKQVQIKTTQGDRIPISEQPEILLVLSLSAEGRFSVVYNGPGEPVWTLVKDRPLPKNGQHQVSLSRLRSLSGLQPADAALPMVRYDDT